MARRARGIQSVYILIRPLFHLEGANRSKQPKQTNSELYTATEQSNEQASERATSQPTDRNE